MHKELEIHFLSSGGSAQKKNNAEERNNFLKLALMGMLGLFNGEAVGPLNDIIPYPDFGMTKVNIVDHTHPITSTEPDHHWILYYWGPALNSYDGNNVSILARYDRNNLPAMVAFTYGSGRVFLTGPYPEFEEDSIRDGVALGDDFDDQGSEWELTRKAVAWIQGR